MGFESLYNVLGEEGKIWATVKFGVGRGLSGQSACHRSPRTWVWSHCTHRKGQMCTCNLSDGEAERAHGARWSASWAELATLSQNLDIRHQLLSSMRSLIHTRMHAATHIQTFLRKASGSNSVCFHGLHYDCKCFTAWSKGWGFHIHYPDSLAHVLNPSFALYRWRKLGSVIILCQGHRRSWPQSPGLLNLDTRVRETRDTVQTNIISESTWPLIIL